MVAEEKAVAARKEIMSTSTIQDSAIELKRQTFSFPMSRFIKALQLILAYIIHLWTEDLHSV
jgi:hypothetical protein